MESTLSLAEAAEAEDRTDTIPMVERAGERAAAAAVSLLEERGATLEEEEQEAPT